MARYRVIGQHEVLGHKPGEEFSARLDKVLEARLIAGGHIERIKESRANGGEKNKNEQTADEA